MNATAADKDFWREHITPIIEAFLEFRKSDPVLRDLLIPDSSVESFKQFHLNWDDDAAHCSVPFLAYKKKTLEGLCAPLEEIIFNRRRGVEALTSQYKSDLKEDWYLSSDANKRQARCNKFLGKFFEFHAAYSLESHFGWQLVDMEAFKHSDASIDRPDFMFRTDSGETVAVSCKTLCQSPEVFDLNQQALANDGVAVGWMSPYAPINYLQFRINEAVKGLQKFDGKRKVALIQLMHPENFKLQLDDNWIDISEADRHGEVDGVIISTVDTLKLSINKQHWWREID